MLEFGPQPEGGTIMKLRGKKKHILYKQNDSPFISMGKIFNHSKIQFLPFQNGVT